jgi:hypothetical protein
MNNNDPLMETILKSSISVWNFASETSAGKSNLPHFDNKTFFDINNFQ